MFKKWLASRAARKEQEERIRADAYLTRLRNSAFGYRGHRHVGEGPFLSIEEVRGLLYDELNRATQEKKP